MSQTVAVLGASQNPERFSHKAFHALKQHGHHAVPVNPFIGMLEKDPVAGNLRELDEHIDTLTVYVNPRVSSELKEDILAMKPSRVIFNPGAENRLLEDELESAGIHCMEDCTLTLLEKEQF